jgi:hypothetical protein
MIRELLPLKAYENAQQTSQVHTSLVMAALWGVPMTFVIVLLANDDVIGLIFRLVIAAAAALAFGFLWTYMFTRAMRRLMRRIYQGDPRIVPPPPAGEYDYRFPCSYLVSPLLAVGGHLYVGPAALTFMPHRKNLVRHQVPLSIPATPEPVIEPVAVTLPRAQRLMAGVPTASRLQVRTPALTATFVAPEPDLVAERLREYLRTSTPDR